MSANLDIVRSIYADWERGDFSRTDWADPEIEYSWVEGPAPHTWTGLRGMEEANRDFLSAWEKARFEADQYRELDGARVLVLMRFYGRGKVSGLDVGQMPSMGAALFQVRDGTVSRLVLSFDRDRVLSDLGLAPEEQDDPR